MGDNTDSDFMHFLESMINLGALHRMTADLDNDLKDSQAVMDEIKGMLEALPPRVVNPDNDGMREEDTLNLIEADTPHLLMPDMEVNLDLNLDDVMASMKSYIERIKKNFPLSKPVTQARESTKDLGGLELEQYVSSLDQLCKRLSHLKLTKNAEESNNAELESKLTLLCNDVNTFTKMIQAKSALSDACKASSSPAPQTTDFLDYNNLVNKLLTDIEEVSCLLRSTN